MATRDEEKGGPRSPEPGAWHAELDRRRAAAQTEERHGAGRIEAMWGRPQRAEGCHLPDGTVTEAVVAALPPGVHRPAFLHAPNGEGDVDGSSRIAPEDCVWLRRLGPGNPVARRGRVEVDPQMGLRFVDDAEAGEGLDAGDGKGPAKPPSLERDLAGSPGIGRRIASDLFARLLYAALCNTEWRHRETEAVWSCSWRSAGGIVAHLRGEGDYVDWYCAGNEGLVDEGVLEEIEALGWHLARHPGAVADEADRHD